jgi:hypothetical protein
MVTGRKAAQVGMERPAVLKPPREVMLRWKEQKGIRAEGSWDPAVVRCTE